MEGGLLGFYTFWNKRENKKFRVICGFLLASTYQVHSSFSICSYLCTVVDMAKSIQAL
jgi:hypothetical protein